MGNFLILAVVLLNYCFKDTAGWYDVPKWQLNLPSSVEWTMTDLSNDSDYYLNVKQYYSVRENKLRWDLDDEFSFVVWSLSDGKLFYVFPARVDGHDMTLMSEVTLPFLMDTTQRQRFLTIIYPDMTDYTLKFNDSQNYLERWERMEQDPSKPYYKSTILLSMRSRVQPAILEVTLQDDQGMIITHYRNHRYEEPDESIWALPNSHPWRKENGTMTSKLFEEMLTQTYLRGQHRIWPQNMPFMLQGNAQDAIGGDDDARLRLGFPQHLAPFPYLPDYYECYRYPKALDWTTCNAVTRVKDQDICAACGAFAAVGVLESAYFISQGQLIDMSEQAVVDCSWGNRMVGRQRVNSGCYSGFPDAAFEWVAENNGIPTTQQYGDYKRMHARCKLDREHGFNLVAPIISYTKVPNTVNAMKMALLRHGPVAAGISVEELDHYQNGIINTPPIEGAAIQHAVLVVGYSVTESGETFWIVKNSWGKRWGVNGYFYVLANETSNPMLLLSDAYYVNMKNNGSPRTYCDICGTC